MNAIEIAIVVFVVAYVVVAIANIPLTIWVEKLRAKNENENNACIYFLYKEIKRYNDSHSEK